AAPLALRCSAKLSAITPDKQRGDKSGHDCAKFNGGSRCTVPGIKSLLHSDRIRSGHTPLAGNLEEMRERDSSSEGAQQQSDHPENGRRHERTSLRAMDSGLVLLLSQLAPERPIGPVYGADGGRFTASGKKHRR